MPHESESSTDQAGSRVTATEPAVVLCAGDEVIARGLYTGEEHARSAHASDVIDTVLAEGQTLGTGVVLGPGRFVLDRPIRLRSGMRMSGAGVATKLSLRDGVDEDAVVIVDDARGVEIADLTVTGHPGRTTRNGLVISSSFSVRVRNVGALGFAENGIQLSDNSALCHIDGCTVAFNARANIALTGLRTGRYGSFVPNLVTNCIAFGGGVGFSCEGAIVANFTGCVACQTEGPGFLLVGLSNSVCVSGCRTFQIQDDAVRIEDSHEVNLTGNIFCWHTGHGIAVHGSRWGTITGNELIDNGSHNPGGPNFATQFDQLPSQPPNLDGIHLADVYGYTVTGNAIFNWGAAGKMGVGIREHANCRDNVISSNNVNYYATDVTELAGRRTVGVNNMGYADEPHKPPPPHRWPHNVAIQSFQPELIQEAARSML